MKNVKAVAILLLLSVCGSVSAGCYPAGRTDFLRELRRGGFTGLASGEFEFKASAGRHCFYSYQHSASTQGATTSWALVVFKGGTYLGLYEVAPSRIRVAGERVVVRDIFGQTDSFKLSDMVVGKKIFLIDDDHVFSK